VFSVAARRESPTPPGARRSRRARRVRADPDSDPGPPHDRSRIDAAILDEQASAEQIEPVLAERNPHRHRQISRAATEIARADRKAGRCVRPFIARARRRRITSIPLSGASARINTAAGDPCASVTTFTRQWMP